MAKGLFIVFEGCEGSGKSTQAELLRSNLRRVDLDPVLVHEPGTTTLGTYLRNYLKGNQPLTKESELLLFEAARAQLIAEIISPALARGRIVISDRFIASSIAYQGYGRRIRLDTVRRFNEFATAGITPDLTILLDIQPKKGLERVVTQLPLDLEDDGSSTGRLDDEEHRHFEDLPMNFHERVRKGYLKQARSSPGWLIIDARLSREEITEQVLQAVGSLICKKEAPPETEGLARLL